MRHSTAAVIAFACAALAPGALYSYTTYARWDSPPAYLLNPANADGLSAVAVETALQTGLNAWQTQSGSAFTAQYGGRVSDTSIANDRRNVVIFRNTTNGSTIASTYSWWDANNTLLDSDIIFWDGGFTFFAGGGCGGSNAAYIEDIAAHEFGHWIGLNHSTATDATMYPGYSTCSTSQRTLAADDIAGARALYPGVASNTAPSVAIASPSSGTSVSQSTSVTFAASASDVEDGDVSASLVWSSNVDGQIGTGPSFVRTLSPGTHTITVRASDAAGLSGTKQTSVTVTTTASTNTRTLTTRGYRSKSSIRAELRWTGLSSSVVSVYRDGTRLVDTANDGVHKDTLGDRSGSGAWTYVVCEAGNTAACTNASTVRF